FNLREHRLGHPGASRQFVERQLMRLAQRLQGGSDGGRAIGYRRGQGGLHCECLFDILPALFDILNCSFYRRNRFYRTGGMATSEDFYASLRNELGSIEEAGLCKAERIIASPQAGEIHLQDGSTLINLCANNYLGWSSQ